MGKSSPTTVPYPSTRLRRRLTDLAWRLTCLIATALASEFLTSTLTRTLVQATVITLVTLVPTEWHEHPSDLRSVGRSENAPDSDITGRIKKEIPTRSERFIVFTVISCGQRLVFEVFEVQVHYFEIMDSAKSLSALPAQCRTPEQPSAI